MAEKRELSVEEIQAVARALGDPRRYEILRKIASREEAATACESIRGCVGVSPATLSHHMRELELAGLIKVERKGKFAFYQISRETLDAYLAQVGKDLLLP